MGYPGGTWQFLDLQPLLSFLPSPFAHKKDFQRNPYLAHESFSSSLMIETQVSPVSQVWDHLRVRLISRWRSLVSSFLADWLFTRGDGYSVFLSTVVNRAPLCAD